MSELRVDNIVSQDGTAAPVYSQGVIVGSGKTFTVRGDVDFQSGANVSGADDFAIIDTSVRLVDADLTLNGGANDALIAIQKTHVRIDDGYTLDITGDRHLIINHYNLPHTVV